MPVVVMVLVIIFQSTLPRGSDNTDDDKVFGYQDFNPRSLAGATLEKDLRTKDLEFQSTLPRGSDKALFGAWNHFADFNPRSLAGATLNKEIYAQGNEISIHAPSRERP